jgi:hypothetical protein
MNGPNRWSQCAEFISGRSGKQCRERWCNSLCPGVKKGNWTSDEDYMIFKLFSEYGSKWAKISSFLKGRTENSIKNRFYSTLRRLAYEKQKKENVSQIPRDKFISQKDLLLYLPVAIEEKEFLYNQEKQGLEQAKNGYLNNSSSEDSNASSSLNNKMVKVKKIIDKEENLSETVSSCEKKKPVISSPNNNIMMPIGGMQGGNTIGKGVAGSYPIMPNNINVNFNTAVYAPPNDLQVNNYLNNLLLYKMNCLESLYNQTRNEVSSFNSMKSQFINIYSMMQGNGTQGTGVNHHNGQI